MPFELDTSELFAGQETVTQETVDQNNDAESDAGALDVDPPAAGAATEGTDPPEGGRKQVPLGALQEERQRRQELAADLQREREQSRILQDRMNQFLLAQQQAAQPQEQEEQIPAFADDPEGHLAAITRQFEKRLEALTNQSQQSTQATQHQQFQQQLVRDAANSEVAFRAKQPDYDQAAAFFTERKTQEYMAIGYDAFGAAERVRQDYFGLTAAAKQQNRDPAEMLYNLSKAVGYTPPNKQQPAGQQQQQQQTHQPAPTSLSALPGASGPDETGKLTADKVANMSDAEFEKLCKEMRRNQGNSRPRI